MEDKRENNLEVIKTKTSNKKIHIELLRCIAIFLVIYNHTGLKDFQLFLITNDSLLFIVDMAMAIISKAAVPIFFMISGALLLGKEEDIKTLYKKRISRIIIVIILASFVQYIYRNGLDINLTTFIIKIYTDSITIPYWFLYSYLAFLIMLPFLRNLVKNMKKENYYYLFAIYIVYKLIVPIIEQRFSITLNSQLNIYLLEINIICPIIGYFCENVLDIKKISKKVILIMILLIIAILICAEILMILDMRKTGNITVQDYLSYGDVFLAMCIYVFTKYIFYDKQLPKYINKIIITVGGCSFGIYLVEEILRLNMLNPIVSTLQPFILTLPACIVAVICIIAVGTIITKILKLIPGIKKLI